MRFKQVITLFISITLILLLIPTATANDQIYQRPINTLSDEYWVDFHVNTNYASDTAQPIYESATGYIEGEQSAIDNHYTYNAYYFWDWSKSMIIEGSMKPAKIFNILTSGGVKEPEYVCQWHWGWPPIICYWIPGYNYIYTYLGEKIKYSDIPSLYHSNYPDNTRAALAVILSPKSGYNTHHFYPLSIAFVGSGARVFVGFNDEPSIPITDISLAWFAKHLYDAISMGFSIQDSVEYAVGQVDTIDACEVVINGNNSLILVS